MKTNALFACAAARGIEGQRYLSEEAPTLPLSSCTNPARCRCVYEKFDDRRTSPRREADIGLPMRQFSPEKRAGQGRRVTDGYPADGGGSRRAGRPPGSTPTRQAARRSRS